MNRQGKVSASPAIGRRARTDIMTERDNEIAELSKDLLGRIVQGTVVNGAPVDAEQCAALAVQCATALVDKLDARGG
ncbi:hypothetical protein WT39_19535 [Burkholderia territorii]|nr:hypothetical protein WT39_19535 [Burkholderia territorii]